MNRLAIRRRVYVLLAAGLVWSCASSSGPTTKIGPEKTEAASPMVAAEPLSGTDASGLALTLRPDSENIADVRESESAVETPEPAPIAVTETPSWPPIDVRPSKTWPFYHWDSAQAFTYNLSRPGPGMPLHVWRPKQGLHPTATPGPMLSKKQAQQAEGNLKMTLGGFEVSKCAFPRHGVIFYADKIPVGSISVCFECGDILIWPAYKQAANWQEKKYKMYRKLQKGYNRVFPKWKRLFGDKLGLATDWTKLP